VLAEGADVPACVGPFTVSVPAGEQPTATTAAMATAAAPPVCRRAFTSASLWRRAEREHGLHVTPRGKAPLIPWREAPPIAVEPVGDGEIPLGVGALVVQRHVRGAVPDDNAIRKVLCSTNSTESLNARHRRAVNAKGHFPTEQAALKTLYLVSRPGRQRGSDRHDGSTQWKPALKAFAITLVAGGARRPDRPHHGPGCAGGARGDPSPHPAGGPPQLQRDATSFVVAQDRVTCPVAVRVEPMTSDVADRAWLVTEALVALRSRLSRWPKPRPARG